MNIDGLRNATPGTQNVTHLNNAGASLPPQSVTDAMISYLKEEAKFGGYETAARHHQSIEETYGTIGRFINAEANEIALVENATAAWNMAFFAVDFEDGDRILTSMAEYASNFINYLKLGEQVDVEIDVIPNDQYGQTSVPALRDMMDANVKLISITHIPTNSGLVNPVEEIGEVATEYDCLYLVDGCQSVGQYPVDVKKIGCDMLSATGRKYLRGPRGTGFLYVNSNALSQLDPPFLDLHAAEWTGQETYKMRDDARRFENWEANYGAVLGLKEAVHYADELGIKNTWNRITKLAEQLREKLSTLSAVTVQDIGQTQCGIVTFTVDGHAAEDIKEALSKKNINVSTSSQRSTLLDMQQRNLTEVIRASVHYYNTEEELEKLIDALNAM